MNRVREEVGARHVPVKCIGVLGLDYMRSAAKFHVGRAAAHGDNCRHSRFGDTNRVDGSDMAIVSRAKGSAIMGAKLVLHGGCDFVRE